MIFDGIALPLAIGIASDSLVYRGTQYIARKNNLGSYVLDRVCRCLVICRAVAYAASNILVREIHMRLSRARCV